MASVASQSTATAKATAKQSIERTGFYLLKDQGTENSEQGGYSAKGRLFARFYDEGYRTKTTDGLDFIIRNTLGDIVIGDIVRSIIPLQRWGYLRLFSDRLPPEYAWFFHIRDSKKKEEAIHTLQVQFWMPGSSVVYYEGTHSQSFQAEDPDNWGVLRTPASNMERQDICKTVVDMPNGGCTIIDSRLGWTCRRGKFINVGFGTDDEVATWDKMPLPDTKALRRKVDELESSGYRTNFTFESTEVSR